VALGRAIVREPDAFLLDEPLANLDAQLRVDMRRELKELHRRLQATMIYVTHDQVEALTLGDRMGVMDRGELQQVGTPQEVYDRPRNRFVAGFLGSPAMNFLEGRLFSSRGGIQFQSRGVAVPLAPAADGPGSLFPASLPEDAGWTFPQAILAARLNQPVVLGVRPEDVLLRELGAGLAGPEVAARARVSLVESVGDASLIHLEVEAGDDGALLPAAAFPPKLISKAEARTAARRGDVREVVFRPLRIHLFDGSTGENLAVFRSTPLSTV
jgi:multiple sugar transport system ATP-binding protein